MHTSTSRSMGCMLWSVTFYMRGDYAFNVFINSLSKYNQNIDIGQFDIRKWPQVALLRGMIKMG